MHHITYKSDDDITKGLSSPLMGHGGCIVLVFILAVHSSNTNSTSNKNNSNKNAYFWCPITDESKILTKRCCSKVKKRENIVIL